MAARSAKPGKTPVPVVGVGAPADGLEAGAGRELPRRRRRLEAKNSPAPDRPLHEMQVHRIRPEMQNDELRQDQGALEKSRDRYLELYDFAPVAYFMLRHDGLIVEANLKGAELLGIPRARLLRRGFGGFVAAGFEDEWARHFRQTLDRREAQRCELQLRGADGTIFWAQLDMLAAGADAVEDTVRVVVGDIEERKRAEAEASEHSAQLKLLSQQLASANEAMRKAIAELERISRIDCLLGIANRRHFDDTIAREWRRALRENRPVALLMIDVDHFKNYNDSHGHQAGDECLRTIAQVCTSALHRAADVAARYGGEELAVILPDTDLEGAERLARDIRSQVAQLRLPHGSSPVADYLTVSVGAAAMLPQKDAGAGDLIAAADRALYAAKAGGRDRVAARPGQAGRNGGGRS